MYTAGYGFCRDVARLIPDTVKHVVHHTSAFSGEWQAAFCNNQQNELKIQLEVSEDAQGQLRYDITVIGNNGQSSLENILNLDPEYARLEYIKFSKLSFTSRGVDISRQELLELFPRLLRFADASTTVEIKPQWIKAFLVHVLAFFATDTNIRHYSVLLEKDVETAGTEKFVVEKMTQLKFLKMELLGEWSYQIFKPIKKAFAEGRFTFLSLRTPDNVLVPGQSAPVQVPAASAPVTLDLIKPLFGRWIRTKGKEEIAFCGRLKSNLLNQIKSHMAKYIAKECQSRHGPFIYDILDLRLSIRKKWESDLIVSIDNTSEVVSIFTHPIADRAKRSSLVWWCLGRHSWFNHHRKGQLRICNKQM